MKSFKIDTSQLDSWNGIGLTLYGKDDILPDTSYVATKWFIFFFLPLIPLGSYRVLVGESEGVVFGVRTSYRMMKVPFNAKQALKTFLSAWLIGIAIFLFLLWLAFQD